MTTPPLPSSAQTALEEVVTCFSDDGVAMMDLDAETIAAARIRSLAAQSARSET